MKDQKKHLLNEIDDVKKIRLEELSLSGYTVKPLIRVGIETLGDVSAKPREFFEDLGQYRKSSFAELEETLKKYGLNFSESVEMKGIEVLELSPKIYSYLKYRKINTVKDLLKRDRIELDDKELVEVLNKMIALGVTKKKINGMISKYAYYSYDKEKELHRILELTSGKCITEDFEKNIPGIAKSFMRMTTESFNYRFRSLYISKETRLLGSKSEREEEFLKQTKKVNDYLNSYMKKFEKAVWDEYRGYLSWIPAKDRKAYMKMAKDYFENTFKIIEKEKEKYIQIMDIMKEHAELNVLHINKLKLYFPLEIESMVCHSLVPYTNESRYVYNDEHYEMKCNKLKNELQITLEYEATSKVDSTYELRIKPESRGYYGGSSSYSCSSSSYKESLGEKLRAEIVGTATFLSCFLPW